VVDGEAMTEKLAEVVGDHASSSQAVPGAGFQVEDSATPGRIELAMTDLTAKRTLVKSPPELWAELSEVDSLARHLGEFGEIRITRTEPQTTVAWEGEHASGTVELEESGWGTKVTLTAEMAEPEPEPPAPVVVPAPSEPEKRRGFFSRMRPRRKAPAVSRDDGPEPVMAASISDGALTVVEKGRVARRPEPPLGTQQALTVLEDTLESLGQAHHRPFSRG